MEQHDIVRDGDIILVVKGNIKLRVYSLVLRLNSPVFRAMLGQHWSEGKGLANSTIDSPYELDLPDDDAQGIKLMCLIFHCRNEELATLPSPRDLLEFARAADKYDCLMAVKFVGDTWFGSYRWRPNHLHPLHEWANVLEAAVLYDHADSFATISEQLMLQWSITELLDPKIIEGYSSATIDSLSKRNETCYNALKGKINALVEAILAELDPDNEHYENNEPGENPHEDYDLVPTINKRPHKICNFYANHVGKCIARLSLCRLWPARLEPTTLSGLIEGAKDFEWPDDTDHPECGNHQIGDFSELQDPGEPRAIEMEATAHGMTFALCLDCYKAGGKFEGKCRVSHRKE